MDRVVRKKTILVAQGYTQVEGVDYSETFALVAHLESIHIFLAYPSQHYCKWRKVCFLMTP
jgi:hypothetical protein